jgi:hypothetical protein
MRIRTAAAGLLAAVVATVAVPSTAYAGPTDNENGTVAGVTPVNATGDPRRDCPVGNHCVWTRPSWQGKVFRLYFCRTYALSQWNGNGSDFNNQTGGAVALYLDQARRVLSRQSPGSSHTSVDFRPVWYIKNC